MDVRPRDVRRYGSTAAIVLAHLREIGATCDEQTLVLCSEIGRAVGVQGRAASKALGTLQKGKALQMWEARVGCHRVVKLRREEGSRADEVAAGQDSVTQQGVGRLLQSDPLHLGGEPSSTTTSSGMAPRLDTVRALLDAVG